MNYVESIMNEELFLIVSNLCVDDFLSKVHSLEQIVSVFADCTEKENCEYLSN